MGKGWKQKNPALGEVAGFSVWPFPKMFPREAGM
jgi:hypothetical protein